jgi:broad specificity phosphatase PhoE
VIWTSRFKRTKQTASFFSSTDKTLVVEEWAELDEIDAGVCEGLTYEEIAGRWPQDFAARDRDKFNYRYKGGESYADLVRRLEPVVLELESAKRHSSTILIIGHQAVLRVLIGYFMECPTPDIPYIYVPLHTVVQVVPSAYDCGLVEHAVNVPAVNTHRPRPSSIAQQ